LIGENKMEAYKREFIQFLQKAGVLKFGDFTAKSGRKIPYFINAGMIKTGDEIAKLGEFYAKAYFEKVGNKPTVLYGPAYKGISIAVSAAVALSKNGLDVPFFFNRKEAKDHGEGGVFVGYVPQAGEEVVIVEDVITAGTAIRESMAILSNLEDVKVAATFVMVDRKEKGKTDLSAMAEVEQEFGFPVYSVVDVYDIIEFLEEDPANAENVARIRNYLAVNGAKV
jgi:orotate phosphoribosyltransferase